MIYNVSDFGAAGDGVSIDTSAIQAAIDACTVSGGGQVLLSGNKVYRCGSLVLKSNVELHLEEGAVLKASDNLEDFNLFNAPLGNLGTISVPTYENCDYAGKPALYFIYAKDCKNVSITGTGSIDGNEEIFYGTVTPWHIDGSFYPRMPLLFLEHISNLEIREVTLTGSAFWTTHMVGCEHVRIDKIQIRNNLRLANCDGIDPDHCHDVRITNCHIECADDCIVFKNTADNMQYGACEDIYVSGCDLVSTSAAIKFGTESEAPFRNITIENCKIHHTNRGISLQLRDSGCIENITFSDLDIQTRMFSKEHWWGEAEPIAITAIRRKEDTKVGYVKNVLFRNINCCGENGILFYGEENQNISDITLENLSMHLKKETDWPRDFHDLRPNETNVILKDHQSALYLRNARDVTVNNLVLDIDEELSDAIVPFSIENCSYITINKKEV